MENLCSPAHPHREKGQRWCCSSCASIQPEAVPHTELSYLSGSKKAAQGVQGGARMLTWPAPCTGRASPRRASSVNLGTSFSGNWWGPYTLLPRVMMQGSL